MDKEKIISGITETGVVAVVRASSEDEAVRISEACKEGGVSAIEMTFTVPYAHRIIESLSKRYTKGEIILGAGTVMDSETARIAILSGAQYIVSPYFDENTVKCCNRYRTLCMPGAMTIKEVVSAMECGADIIKIFPGGAFGPSIIKDIHGPVPQAKLMPTGGVDVDNIDKWIGAGAVAVGAGSSLTAGAKTGDYEAVKAKAREFVLKVKQAREAK